MSEELTLLTLVSSLASTGITTVIYGKIKKLDNLAALHAKHYPDEADLVR